MNISDVKIDYSKYKDRDMMEVLFENQKTLMDLYKVPTIDLDIPRDQQLIRAMAWSVVEEAGEALEVYYGSKDQEHLGDEIADMAHFFIELLIMSGVSAKDIPYSARYESWIGNPSEPFQNFIMHLSLTVNILKNRFWRKTNLKTDSDRYRLKLMQTVPYFFQFIGSLGIDHKQLFDYYLRKNEVNLFRIRSKY